MSVINLQTLNNFNYHNLNNYPFLAYIYDFNNIKQNYTILIIMDSWKHS
jgi:hypothetical protein